MLSSADEALFRVGDRSLKAMEIDSVAGFRAWSEELKAKLSGAFGSEKGGLHVDANRVLAEQRRTTEQLRKLVTNPQVEIVTGGSS